MRKLSKFTLLPLIAMTLSAATVNLNTGQAMWQVSQTANTGGTGSTNNGAALNSTSTAVTLTGTLPISANFPNIGTNAWATPVAPSAWIGQVETDGQVSGFGCTNSGSTNCGANPGTYVYTLSFGSGFAGGMGSFSFGFTSDNFIQSLTVMQGATTLYTYTPSNENSIQNSLINTGMLSNIVGGGGNVVISATVVNGFVAQGIMDRNPSGFLVQGSATVPDVPEPSTYAMLGLGFAALAAAKLRRK